MRIPNEEDITRLIQNVFIAGQEVKHAQICNCINEHNLNKVAWDVRACCPTRYPTLAEVREFVTW